MTITAIILIVIAIGIISSLMLSSRLRDWANDDAEKFIGIIGTMGVIGFVLQAEFAKCRIGDLPLFLDWLNIIQILTIPVLWFFTWLIVKRWEMLRRSGRNFIPMFILFLALPSMGQNGFGMNVSNTCPSEPHLHIVESSNPYVFTANISNASEFKTAVPISFKIQVIDPASNTLITKGEGNIDDRRNGLRIELSKDCIPLGTPLYLKITSEGYLITQKIFTVYEPR